MKCLVDRSISHISIYKIYLREHAISMEQEAMKTPHVTNPIQLRLPQSSSSMATIRLEYYNNFAPGWNHFSNKYRCSILSRHYITPARCTPRHRSPSINEVILP